MKDGFAKAVDVTYRFCTDPNLRIHDGKLWIVQGESINEYQPIALEEE
jgi:hypothetical protein